MINGHFINSGKGRLFVCQYGKLNPQKTILLLPSVFEELNLCRAILTKQALFLAQQGYCVFGLDYSGTGDSEKDIEQVSADDWLHDIQVTLGWLQGQGVDAVTLWGVRLGGLLAMQNLAELNKIATVKRIVLWKPVSNGKQFMSQFLRLKQANSMMQGKDKTNWREHILAGNLTEVAGYPISSALLSSIDQLTLPSQIDCDADIHWFELSASKITPAVSNQTDKWSAVGPQTHCIEGSAFWQIPEIFSQPHLHQPMLEALQEPS